MSQRISGIRSVCIIGAGPSGVAAAKYLRAENKFSKIDIFEQRSSTAGVWQWVPENDELYTYPIPHTNPDVPVEKPTWRGKDHMNATFQSPIYERLEANLPKMLMQHSDFDFPTDTQLFPKHEQILNYLKRYSRDVEDLITFETQVAKVDIAREEPPSWSVTTENLRTLQSTAREYDAVLVANGHYQIPFVPMYEGLETFNRAYPGVLTHSKYYNSPEDFRGKKVLVVGYGPSGSDIASQISHTAASLHISTRSPPSFPLPEASTHHPAICSFNAATLSITFTDMTELSAVDSVLFSTGYLYSYPFLTPAIRRALDPDNTGSRLHSIYRHLFSIAHPTLALTLIPWNIVPFPLAEAQGAAIARVWAGRLSLPSRAAMYEWEEARETTLRCFGKAFHKLAPPSDVDYLNELHDWCGEADGEAGNAEGQEHGRAMPGVRVGRLPPYWDERMRWMRVTVPKIKAAFAAKGKARHEVRTLDELGFIFRKQESDGS